MKDPKDQICPSFPIMHTFKLIWKYGLKNWREVFVIHKMIHKYYFHLWQERLKYWKTWLDTYRFNSQHPLAVKYRTQYPTAYQYYLDLNRKPDPNASRAMRKIDRCVRKAKNLKYTPKTMPRCLGFKKSYEYYSCLSDCIPYTLERCLNIGHILHEIGTMTSEQITIKLDFSVDNNDSIMSPIGFACVFFMMWSAHTAYYYSNSTKRGSQNFDTCGIGEHGYDNFKKALHMTLAFDVVVAMPSTRRALEVFADWYASQHGITGMYAVLSNHSTSNNSFKHSVVKKELLGDFDVIAETARQRSIKRT